MYFSATAGPSAIDDILNHSRYEGAMESISGISHYIDEISVIFISLTAFLIICVAIWRNVLAAAYAAFPRFWDQVHIAHEAVKDQGWIQRIQNIKTEYVNFNMGTIKQMLMRLCPDVVVLTDFEDDTVEPKTYWTKAIAQMIAVVMIGVFIYNGYYRDVTVQVANFGSVMFERVVLETDPVAIFDSVLNSAGKPEFSTDGSADYSEQQMNDIQTDIYAKVIGKYTDISTARDKAELAASIELVVNTLMNQPLADKSGSDGSTVRDFVSNPNWDMRNDWSFSTAPRETHSSYSTDGQQTAFVWSFDVSELSLNTTKFADEQWYLVGSFTFTKNNKNTGNMGYECMFTLGVSGAIKENNYGSPPASSSAKLRVYKKATLTDPIGNKTINVKTVNGNIITSEALTPGTVYTASGIHYVADGQDNTVTQFKIDTSGKTSVSATVKDANGANATVTASFGEKIDASKAN